MSLREQLKQMVESVGGGIGAIIMGYDGIPIDEYVVPGLQIDLHVMAVEYAALLKEIKKTAEVLKAGDLEEISINTESANIIVRIINAEFFIVLALKPDGNYGKGRYILNRDATGIRQSLQ